MCLKTKRKCLRVWLYSVLKDIATMSYESKVMTAGGARYYIKLMARGGKKYSDR